MDRSRSLATAGLLLLAALVLGGAQPTRAQPVASAAAGRLDAAARARLHAARAVQRRHAADLMALPDVVGTGTGLDPDGEAVIRVFSARPDDGRIPASLEGVPVRTRVTGRIHALRGVTCDTGGDGVCQTTERWPLPVPIGVSVGHPSITAGTIGARVSDGANVFALSNNHVLAASNQAALGDAALQPGPFDGGSLAAGDAIGTLFDFEPIVFCEVIFIFVICEETNRFDAAIALSSPSALGFATPGGEFGSAPGYGAPSPTLHPAYGDPSLQGDEDLALLQQLPVQKVGRTTGRTTGLIDTIQLTVDVCYDETCSLVARFEDQLAVSGAFSAGGDSGSLVVTDDALRQPVALLFAGSSTQTILSRIDLVLDRFGVVVDDGGTTEPVFDAELRDLAPPASPVVGVATTVGVTVRNAGSEPLPGLDVVFTDATEGATSTLPAPPLAPGASAQLAFAWTPLQSGPHTLRAAHALPDDEPGNDQVTAAVEVLLEAPGLSLRLWRGSARTDAWTPVSLGVDYGSEMVVVCTARYDAGGLGPLVTRVRNASGGAFEVGLGRPWFGAFPGEEGSAEVDCMAVRAGVYGPADGAPRMEAVRLDGFAAKDDAYGWTGQSRAYAQAYVRPVVLGQVISAGAAPPGEIGVWSTFWARGASALDPPSPTQLFVGRHTGEDPGARAAESLAYVVIEAGEGWMEGKRFAADVGADSVRGVDDAPPYTYSLPPFLQETTHAVASAAGMDGVEGGWPILFGAGALAPGALRLAFDEDWYFDPERSHPTEQVAYLVFGRAVAPRCGLGFELALLVPVLLALRGARRRGPGPGGAVS